MPLTRLIPLASVLLLAACGGGGGGGPVTVFTYQTIDSDVPGQSSVRAVGVIPQNGNAPDTVENEGGSLQRETQVLVISGLDIDTANRSGDTWTYSEGTVSPSLAPAFSGQYEFFIPVTVTREGQSGTYFLGVATRSEDLPTTGSAVYSGQSQMGGIFNGQQFGEDGSSSFDARGDLTLTADFGSGAGTVRADLTSLMVRDTSTGNMVPAPIEEFQIVGMAIDSASGDAIFIDNGGAQYTADGAAVWDLIGGRTGASASGAFFGGDSGRPTEAGGAFVVTGETGRIWGTFAADERRP